MIVITISVVILLAIIGIAYKVVMARKAGVVETAEDILKSSAEILSGIASDVIEILDIGKLDLTDEEIKDLLAKKIVEVYDNDIGVGASLISDKDKIAFIKTYILSADDIVEKIKEKFFKKQEPAKLEDTTDDEGATEIIHESDIPASTTPPNSTSMLGSINNYYDDTK